MSDEKMKLRRPLRPAGSSMGVSRFLRREPKLAPPISAESPRFLIVEDHPLVRRGIKQLIEETYIRATIDEADCAETAVRCLRTTEYDLVVLDLSLPRQSGLEALHLLQSQKSGIRVAIYSMHAERQFAMRALRSGAHAYVTKDQAPDQLLAAIRKTLAGGVWVSDTLAESITRTASEAGNAPPHTRLSPRELKVLTLLAAGHTVSEISEQLTLSVKTISTYRTRLLEKLAMRTNAELTRYCLDNGLLN